MCRAVAPVQPEQGACDERDRPNPTDNRSGSQPGDSQRAPSALRRRQGEDRARCARAAAGRRGKLVLVSAITPTAAGEGKTTTSIGLAQGLARLGAARLPGAARAVARADLRHEGRRDRRRQRRRVVPADDINLHFTGDFHAVTAAHNLLAALLDNHIHHGNALDIDPRRVLWRRVIDMNDRALRHVVIGLGGVLEGVPRETGFDITAASEVMAMLCLAEDADDLRARLEPHRSSPSRYAKEPVTAADLKAVGRDDGAAQGRAHAQPRADRRGRAGVRPRRPVRQHRPRLQLGRSRRRWRWPTPTGR